MFVIAAGAVSSHVVKLVCHAVDLFQAVIQVQIPVCHIVYAL